MDSLGNPMFIFFILFIVLMNAPPQYTPFGIALTFGAIFTAFFGPEALQAYIKLIEITL